jgi:tetratricopeptide (TPR) repeat protein
MESMRQVLVLAHRHEGALLHVLLAARALRDWPAVAQAAADLLVVAPRHEGGLRIGAEANGHTGDWATASKYYRKLVGLNRRRVDSLLGLARSLGHQGQWRDSLDTAKVVLKHAPDHPPALSVALQACIRLQDFKKASLLWTELARADPSAVVRWLRILVRQAQFEWAAAGFLGLLQGRGGSTEVMADGVWLYGFLTQAADDATRRAQVDLAERAQRALRLLAPVLTGASMAQAPKMIDGDGIVPKPGSSLDGERGDPGPTGSGAVAAVGRAAKTQFQAACVADREGRFSDVIGMLVGQEVLPANRLDSLKLLARAYWHIGDRAQSLGYWKDITVEWPEDATSWLFVARGCKSLRQWKEGRAAAMRRLSLVPGDPAATKLVEEFNQVLRKQGVRE